MRSSLLPAVALLLASCITPPGELPQSDADAGGTDDTSTPVSDTSSPNGSTGDTGGRVDAGSDDTGSTDDRTTSDAGERLRLPFVVSSGTVKEDLTEFPLLVSFSSDELAGFGWQGNEISFVDSQMQPVPFEVESYGSSSGAVRAWVRLPLVTAAADTTFYLVPKAPSGSFRDVWDGYGGVWHFQAIPPNQTRFAERSPNQNHGTPENGAGVDEGKIGPALSLDGISQYVRVPADPSLKPAEFTISVWLRLDDKGVLVTPVSVPYGTGAQNSYQIWVDSAFVYNSWVIHDGVGFSDGAGTVANGDWSHVVLRYDGQAKTQFIDGAEVHTSAAAGTISYDQSDLLIGADRDSGGLRHFVLGRIDELRIAPSAFSDARINAEFVNQGEPGAFVTVGSFEPY